VMVHRMTHALFTIILALVAYWLRAVIWLGVSWAVWWFPRAVHCAAWLAPILALPFNVGPILQDGILPPVWQGILCAMVLAICAELVWTSPLVGVVRLTLKLLPVKMILIVGSVGSAGALIVTRLKQQHIPYLPGACVLVGSFWTAALWHIWSGWCWHSGLIFVVLWILRCACFVVSVFFWTVLVTQTYQKRRHVRNRVDPEVPKISAVAMTVTIAGEICLHLWSGLSKLDMLLWLVSCSHVARQGW
jgi:hypothetical protein